MEFTTEKLLAITQRLTRSVILQQVEINALESALKLPANPDLNAARQAEFEKARPVLDLVASG
jgi:hypothetical protein